LWVSRVIAIRNDGERTRGGRGKRGKCQPGGLSGEAGNAPSLLARKGERNPFQGFRATIERTVSNPATSTPWDIEKQCFRVLLFPPAFSVFSGLQPGRLQQRGEAPNCGFENATSGIFRKFPDFSGFEMSGLVCESEIRKLFPHHNSR